jgi:hypothetical protein
VLVCDALCRDDGLVCSPNDRLPAADGFRHSRLRYRYVLVAVLRYRYVLVAVKLVHPVPGKPWYVPGLKTLDPAEPIEIEKAARVRILTIQALRDQ